MKTRHQPWIFSVSLLFILLLGLLLHFKWPGDKAPNTSYTLDPVLVPMQVELEQLSESPQFQQLDEEAQYEQVLKVLDKMPEEYAPLKRRYQLAMSPLPKIKFWGRVVDQHGQAVEGAYVYHSGQNTWLAAGGGAGYVKTDDEGYFKIRNRGAGLTLGQIIHPELQYSYPWDNNENYKGSKIFINREVEGHEHDSWRKYTKKSQAYDIQVWRLGKYEGAKEGVITTSVSPDSSIKTLRLHQPMGNRAPLGKTEGQFYISCYHPPVSNRNEKADWRFTITPVNGGIQRSNDRYMNHAPETGYQPQWVIDMKVGSPEYRSRQSNQRFYFTANHGQDYGALLLHIDPFKRVDRCGVHALYKINSTGSRSLELKKKPRNLPFPSSQALSNTDLAGLNPELGKQQD